MNQAADAAGRCNRAAVVATTPRAHTMDPGPHLCHMHNPYPPPSSLIANRDTQALPVTSKTVPSFNRVLLLLVLPQC
jgi:hypothetical protein